MFETFRFKLVEFVPNVTYVSPASFVVYVIVAELWDGLAVTELITGGVVSGVAVVVKLRIKSSV